MPMCERVSDIFDLLFCQHNKPVAAVTWKINLTSQSLLYEHFSKPLTEALMLHFDSFGTKVGVERNPGNERRNEENWMIKENRMMFGSVPSLEHESLESIGTYSSNHYSER